MLIVGISGSPDRAGSAIKMIDVRLSGCRELGARTEVIHVMDALEGRDNHYWVACASSCPEICHQNPNLADVYDIIRDASELVIGNPVCLGRRPTGFGHIGEKALSKYYPGWRVIPDKQNCFPSRKRSSLLGQER